MAFPHARLLPDDPCMRSRPTVSDLPRDSVRPRPRIGAIRRVTPADSRGYRLNPPVTQIEQRPRLEVAALEWHPPITNNTIQLRKDLEFLRSPRCASAIESVISFHYLLCFRRLV